MQTLLTFRIITLLDNNPYSQVQIRNFTKTFKAIWQLMMSQQITARSYFMKISEISPLLNREFKGIEFLKIHP